MTSLKLITFFVALVLSLTVIGVKAEASNLAEHDLQQAFFKEYSFLLKEKKAMQQRLRSLKSQIEKEKNTMNTDLNILQEESNLLFLEVDRVNDNLTILERETIAKESSQLVFIATLEQAEATVSNKNDEPLKSIEDTVIKALTLLDKNTGVYVEQGKFYLENGAEVSGDIVNFGAIARFGITKDNIGPLAPAGGGEFKLWSASSQPNVIHNLSQLSVATMPHTLELFLFESATTEVRRATDKDLLSVINSGGMIAWIIVALGGVAVFFALLRAWFLMSLGRNNKRRFVQIAQQVADGSIDKAKQIALKAGGSSKRVMQATLNNLHRDREHVEDTISEAILHEHSSLDRFHSLIMVIAAIAPLLGLLGTVTGMIETFEVITEFGTGDPKLLSGGISIALVTTELGLIVAIPVLVIGTLLASWGTKIKDDLERSALHLVNQYQNQREYKANQTAVTG